MSYTYLQEQGEESLAEFFSDIPAFVLLKLNLTVEKSCSKGNGTESCQSSLSGTILKPLTENLGGDLLMLSAVDSHAKTLLPQAQPQELMESEADYGGTKIESLVKFDLNSHSWKTHHCLWEEDLRESLVTLPEWGMMQNGVCWVLATPEGCTNEIDFGLLHIPTIGKNEFRGTSRKRFVGSQDFRGAKMCEGLRTCETDPTYLNPGFSEKQMDWPIMWTELAPLEMDKFQQWLNSHGNV